MLRLVNRLDEPTQGTVFFQGRDYREVPPLSLRRSIGMVMQRAYLFPGTVAENIAFGPAQQKKVMPPDQIADLLRFVKRWDRRTPLVVHCYMGISRSTASAYASVCALNPDRSETDIAQSLRQASPTATQLPQICKGDCQFVAFCPK